MDRTRTRIRANEGGVRIISDRFRVNNLHGPLIKPLQKCAKYRYVHRTRKNFAGTRAQRRLPRFIITVKKKTCTQKIVRFRSAHLMKNDVEHRLLCSEVHYYYNYVLLLLCTRVHNTILCTTRNQSFNMIYTKRVIFLSRRCVRNMCCKKF